MQIHLSPRHLTLTAAIHEAVAAQIGQLEHFGIEILGAHVVLLAANAEAGHRYTVKAHLAVPGPDIHAEESANDLYAALELVSDKLARQLRKRKTSMKDKRRTKTQRGAEAARSSGKPLASRRSVARVAPRASA